MEKRINYTINYITENMHREYFEVLCDAETVHLNILMPEVCRCMGFVILEDPRGQVRLQKLLGYGEQRLAVGRSGENTSIGGVPGKIEPGRWKLTLGIFADYVQQKPGGQEAVIQAVLTDMQEEITEPVGCWVWTKDGECVLSDEKYGWEEIYSLHAGWYKGDFHTHTTLSDGKETTVGATEKARQMELDFYVPTEHNLMHTGWCAKDICILPGIEITTDNGHFNLFGVQRLPKRLMEIVARNGEDIVEQYVREVMQEAKREDWIVSLNHPFLTIWSWRYSRVRIEEFDCVEIINDPTYPAAPESNDRAIRFLDTLWQDGHRIYGVGGSDSHNLDDEYYEGADGPSIVGDPGTYVYCNTLTPAELMRQVKRGHICVTRFCQIEPSITMNGTCYLPGDEILGKEAEEGTLHYHARITGLQEEPVIRLFINGKALPVYPSAKEDGTFEADMTVTLHFKKWTWVRMEVRRRDGIFLGYINPVYCGKKEPCFQTFGEIISLMGEE